MGFFGRVREFVREVKEDAQAQRVKAQRKFYDESKPTDEFVTMEVTGDGEMKGYAKLGWDVIVQTTKSEYTWMNVYLMRRSRKALARSLEVEA